MREKWGTQFCFISRLLLCDFGSMKVEELLHLFAVIVEGPVFSVMVGVEHGNHYALHVTGIRSREIRGIEKVEGDGLAIGGCRSRHARLVARSAVVREHEAVRAVEMKHGNHVLGAVAMNIAHQG